MPLQLLIGQGGHFFVDTFLDCTVQVGQAYQKSDGSWTVEVNDELLSVPDLEAAKRLFVEKYDRSLVQLNPASLGGEDENLSAGFSVIDLTPLEKSVRRVPRADRQMSVIESPFL
jgi:hypothetical protein